MMKKKLMREECKRRRGAWFGVGLGLSGAVFPVTAAACPRCSVGEQARAEVLRDDFGRRFAAALLPFAVIGAVSALAARVGSRK